MLRRLLSLPLLLPLLAVLLIAGLNPRPQLSLRLLTWRSPSLPLGAWIALAATGGATLSAAAAAAALAGPVRPLRRRLRREPGATAAAWDEGERVGARRSDQAAAGWREAARSSRAPGGPSAGWQDGGPSRAPGEPAPTVEVPFRVIRRGSPASGSQRPVATVRPGGSTAAAQGGRSPEAGSTAADDWDTPASDSW